VEQGRERERRLGLATSVCNQLPTFAILPMPTSMRSPQQRFSLFISVSGGSGTGASISCADDILIMPTSRRKNPKEYKQF